MAFLFNASKNIIGILMISIKLSSCKGFIFRVSRTIFYNPMILKSSSSLGI